MFGHIDADAFFASALQRRQPKLIGKPILALGMGGGCVIAASYEAKAFGVKTGMRLTEARKLCPQALAMPSDFPEALKASREIESIIFNHCPVMERASVDEWYLDMTSIVNYRKTDLVAWAEDLQQTVKRKTALGVSIGIASTKLLAKMAGEYKKPAGITVLKKEEDIDPFLKDRVAAAIPGIGKRRMLHAESYGWNTAYDFTHADKETVKRLFGKPGLEMQQELQGEALWDIATESTPPKSISRCRSFRATNDANVMFSHLLDHLTYTVMKLRRHQLMCTHISVWLRSGEYKGEGRDVRLPQPMCTEEQLLPYTRFLFERLLKKVPLCTQVGLGLMQLKPVGGVQYSLFQDPKKTNDAEEIQEALDSVHDKYGRDALSRASAMPTNTGSKKKGLHIVDPS